MLNLMGYCGRCNDSVDMTVLEKGELRNAAVVSLPKKVYILESDGERKTQAGIYIDLR